MYSIPCFLNICEGPTLVSVLANGKKSKENFPFYEKGHYSANVGLFVRGKILFRYPLGQLKQVLMQVFVKAKLLNVNYQRVGHTFCLMPFQLMKDIIVGSAFGQWGKPVSILTKTV